MQPPENLDIGKSSHKSPAATNKRTGLRSASAFIIAAPMWPAAAECDTTLFFTTETGNSNSLQMQLTTYRQQPLPLLGIIDIRPARNSRLTQRETNHYIARCASVFAWSYLAGRLPEQLVIDLFAQHQRFVVCYPQSTNLLTSYSLRFT